MKWDKKDKKNDGVFDQSAARDRSDATAACRWLQGTRVKGRGQRVSHPIDHNPDISVIYFSQSLKLPSWTFTTRLEETFLSLRGSTALAVQFY